MKQANNLYEIVYKSYEILFKNLESIDLDSILDLAFDYLDLKLLWIGTLSHDKLNVNKAKGEATDYINNESLRNYQINIVKSFLGNVFVSNDVLSDERLGHLKDKALVFGFNSIFSNSFKINDTDWSFITFYAKGKNYFDKRAQEILKNFSNAIKTAILLEEREKYHFMLSKIIEDSYQGVVITDHENKIVYTNNAFTQITGYTFEEAKGKKPSILKSGYHPKEFYIEMWHKILHDGFFNGKIYNKRKDGETYEELIFIKAIKDKDGHIVNYFSFFFDLTELNKTQEEVKYYIYHDPTTKLINKLGFFEQAQRIIDKNESFAVIYIDLDDFSVINTNIGIEKGDRLLKDFSDFLLKEIADPKDIVSRFGSDEFVILKRSMIEQNVTQFVRRSIEKIRQKAFFVDNEKVYLKVSAGIVLYPKDSYDINAIINYAQAACRKAKHLGKNQCVFFNESIYSEFINDYRLLNEITRAIEFKEFELYFQPIYNTHTLNITNAEALIRWNHPSKGLLTPYHFMPFAEKSEIIEKLDFYVLEKAFQTINRLKLDGLDIVLSVNQTARTFLLDNFVDEFRALMEKYKIEPNLIKIELTETLALSNEQKVKQNMQALNDLGVEFSMDDFGTGYSSILTLKKFPFSNIKLDQNFVMDSQHNKDSAIISYNLLHMLNQLKFQTTTEGIENEYLFFVFSHLPSDLLQGYFISKPITYKEFVNFCKNFTQDDIIKELTGKSKILDLDAIEAKFYIYKHYKILNENIKGKLAGNYIEDLSNMIELDYKHCDFGIWYYSLYSKYSSMETFKRIEQLHIDVHNTTEKLLSEKNKENIETLFDNLKDKIIQLNNTFENFLLEIANT